MVQREATIIASQLPVSNWCNIIGKETIADAILNWLVHTSHRIELKGGYFGEVDPPF